ncbi:Ig-like domain-containing protein [Deinococcus saxicola]|uniref:Ig-like domain-containing protein n=1 Tax=Deinococcus saxicola TaxID=249406 RepID=UPI0039EE91DC
MFRRPVTIALALTASIAIVSCGDNTAPSTVTSVALTTMPAVSTTSPLVVGSTAQARAVVTATAGTATTVTYTSSSPTVATVDATGLIRAVAPGTTVIKATSTADTSKSAQVTITVVAATSTTPTVTGVTVALNPASVAVGGTSQATASVTGTNNPAQTVTWTSTNTAVATVSATGVVTALTPGTTDIVAISTVDGTRNGKATLTVTATGGGTTLTTAKINFQPATSTTPAGYTANTGAAYNTVSMIGWVTEASVATATPVPLDMTANTRDRGAINGVTDPRQYTQINMQCGNQQTGNPCSSGTLTSGAFQYKVINGKYNVTVGVGEASTDVNSTMQINLESGTANAVTVLSGFVPSATSRTLIKSAAVTVSDGMLTVDAKGGFNTKINFIDIAPAN